MKPLAAITFALLAFLAPPIEVRRYLPALRGEDLVLLVFLCCLCVQPSVCIRKLPRGRHDRVTIAFALMLGVAFLSISVSGLQKSLILNDFMILPMLCKYWLIYMLAQMLSTPATQKWVLWSLLLAISVSALVGILEAHRVGGINGWLSPLYVKGAVKEAMLERSQLGEVDLAFRTGGTHGDPRRYGYLLVVGIAICVSLFLYTRQRHYRLLHACVAALCLVSLIYTMSRTAVFSAGLLTTLGLLIYQRTQGIDPKTLTLWLCFLALGAGVFFGFMTDAARERLFNTDTGSFQNSAIARKRDFITPFSAALSNPAIILIGKGPSKADTKTSAHNDFAWYFQRFGLAGLAFYLFLLWHGPKKAYGTLKCGARQDEGAIHLASLLVLVNWLLFAMAEDIFKDPQIMAINMFFLGLICPIASPYPKQLQPQRASTSPAPLGPVGRQHRPASVFRRWPLGAAWSRRVMVKGTARPAGWRPAVG